MDLFVARYKMSNGQLRTSAMCTGTSPADVFHSIMQNMRDSKTESVDECSGAELLRCVLEMTGRQHVCAVRAQVVKCLFYKLVFRCASRFFGHRKCNMQTAERDERRSVCASPAPTVRRQLVYLYFIRNMININ